MKKFIVLMLCTLVVTVGLSTYNAVASQAVNPEVTTELALEQFADPSLETDTAQRLWNRADITPWVNGGVAFLVSSVWCFAYRKEIMGVFEE